MLFPIGAQVDTSLVDPCRIDGWIIVFLWHFAGSLFLVNILRLECILCNVREEIICGQRIHDSNDEEILQNYAFLVFLDFLAPSAAPKPKRRNLFFPRAPTSVSHSLSGGYVFLVRRPRRPLGAAG